MIFTIDQFLAVIEFVADDDLTEEQKAFVAEQYSHLCPRDKHIAKTHAMDIQIGSPTYRFLHSLEVAA